MKTRSIVLATGLTLMAMTASISAQAKEFEVRYVKAELQTPGGAERVYHRVYDVAEDLCNYEFSHAYATKSRLRYDRCLRRTVKDFVGQIDHPNVDASYVKLPVRRLKDELARPYKLAEVIGK